MKSVIKKERVRVGEAAAHPASTEVHATSSAERRASAPGVRLVRIDGRIEALEVTCRCGEVSVVEIDYDESEVTS